MLENLVIKNDNKILLLVIDGLGGIRNNQGKTELEKAKIPNLDKLAKISSTGRLIPIEHGITPGSGPAHLALFGYDPIKENVGRGVLSALGVGLNLEHNDICARVNLATVDKNNILVDRRAGRIATEENIRICNLLNKKIKIKGVRFIIKTEKEHRAALVIKKIKSEDNVNDTDPQVTGVKPLIIKAKDTKSKLTAKILNEFLKQAYKILKNEKAANCILLRGIAKYRKYKTLKEKYLLDALCLASYPMYKGVSKLVGMDIGEVEENCKEKLQKLEENYKKYDYFYVHFKKTDSYGEDGNFAQKVKVLEQIDREFIKNLDINKFSVIAVTGDHCTPAMLKAHSFHPVPLLIYSKNSIADNISKFDEINVVSGNLGIFKSKYLINYLLAYSLRLKKYGA